MLLVGNGKDGSFDLAIRKHGLQVRNRGDTGVLFEGRAFLFGAAECGNDLDFVGLCGGACQDFGPAAKAHNADFDGVCGHLKVQHGPFYSIRAGEGIPSCLGSDEFAHSAKKDS